MKIPVPLEGMPPWLQSMLENENRRPVVIVQRKRFSFSMFFLKLIIGIILVLVGVFVFLNFLPDIIILGGL